MGYDGPFEIILSSQRRSYEQRGKNKYNLFLGNPPELQFLSILINSCQREGIVFLPFALETLGGLHKGAITQVKLIATALVRCKGVDEGEATGQLFGRLSQILMKANSLMLSTRCQDSDFSSSAIDGIE